MGNLANQCLILALVRLSKCLHHVESLVGKFLGQEEVSIIEFEQGALLDLVIALGVVLVQDTLDFLAEIALNVAGLPQVVGNASAALLAEAHDDCLQANEGVSKLLFDCDLLLHLESQFIG